jgi:hypothetical protein
MTDSALISCIASPRAALPARSVRDYCLTLAVVTIDAGRTLIKLDVGDRRERNAAAAHRHLQLLKHPLVGPGAGFELNLNGDQAIARIELGKRRTDVTNSRHPDRFGQTLGRHAKTNGQVRSRADAKLWSIKRDVRGAGWRRGGRSEQASPRLPARDDLEQ